MSHAAAAGHAAPPNPFSDSEWVEFDREDKQAATYIVCLMTGIFIMGLIGYFCVCLWIG